MLIQAMQVCLDHQMAVLFYCAHIKKFHSLLFGTSIDMISSMLQSPATHFRLLTRLTIGCLLPILQRHHMSLMEMTEEEAELLLNYIKHLNLPGGLDSAKLLMATSILYRFSQNASSSFTRDIAQQTVDVILQQNLSYSTLEGALCLLWALCHSPDMALHMSQEHTLVQVLTWMQQSPCSAVAFPARAVLWQLGYGNHEGNVMMHSIYLSTISVS